ncbi:sulfurtransferase complex subunit TusC [Vibrio sp. S17_S38]|uniref:sulfurtransferase complex subunit TusC n=1 Tax=Vibrio sp. S17_S38 TaxID=2720229 RepID=UPI001681963C|nr:sulfurtransferase complex subunit TusC [Vibrio sp. S17_S38]MBD1573024.1 sulfurtransferase complex subunit TusC [Vibrio sp. S17_S38]
MKLGFVFRSFPHTTAKGREGLDALLATSVYSENIDVFFIGAGVTQLLLNQDPEQVLSRDYTAAFKLLELYDIENIYVCELSLKHYEITPSALMIPVIPLSSRDLNNKLHQCNKLLSF